MKTNKEQFKNALSKIFDEDKIAKIVISNPIKKDVKYKKLLLKTN